MSMLSFPQVRLITDADDKPIDGEADTETIEIYMIHRPQKYLLDLPMIDNYISGSPECRDYVLPGDRASDAPSWGPAQVKVLQ